MSHARLFGAALVLVAVLGSYTLRPVAGCWKRTACSMHGDANTCRVACSARRAAPAAEQNCHAQEPQESDCSITSSCDRTDDAATPDLLAVLPAPVELALPTAAGYREPLHPHLQRGSCAPTEHPPRLFLRAV